MSIVPFYIVIVGVINVLLPTARETQVVTRHDDLVQIVWFCIELFQYVNCDDRAENRPAFISEYIIL